MKTNKKIVLEDHTNFKTFTKSVKNYVVNSLTNTTKYHVGDWLTQEMVYSLIVSGQYTVQINRPKGR